MAKAETGDTSWPDVALALIAFAREEPLVFCGVLGFGCIALWLLLPRMRYLAGKRLERTLEEHDRQLDLPYGTRGKREDDDA